MSKFLWRMNRGDSEPYEIMVKKETDQFVLFSNGRRQAKTTNKQVIRQTRAEAIEAMAELLFQESVLAEQRFLDFCQNNQVRAQKYNG